jgi:polygalacturonase
MFSLGNFSPEKLQMCSGRASFCEPKLVLVAVTALGVALASCDGSSSGNTNSDVPFRVGTTRFDPKLPPEPRLPAEDEVCATLEANDLYVRRPDGALPPEADPSPAGVSVAADPGVVNPDQERIQAALDDCGAAVDAEVGAAIAAVDAEATDAQTAAALPNVNIKGALGEELAKPKYRASRYAVRLVKNKSDNGRGNAFISGPLTLPSGVTLWIDKDVTLFATRDVMAYSPKAAGPYCGNTAVSQTKGGSSGNCLPLIGGSNLVNSAIVGDGSIDSRAYAELVTTNALYPLMKVDLTCSNTYAAYATGEQATDGTACDNGGTIVNSKSSSRNMTWWDLAWLGNMVENGRTGTSSQSNFRMMVFSYVKNLTLYRITMNNSANFHFVPSGIDGLTVWGVKLQTPTQAAYANPVGNLNPLYTGDYFGEDNVKNTDAFDPGSASKPLQVALTTGSTTTSSDKISFDGYLKNVVFAYNFVSTGDDDIVLKGSNNPSPADSGLPGIDGNRDVRANRAYGIVIAHNHIYWGHGISIGSETNSGVRNVHIYDNSFDESEEGLRIKSDYARGGEVSKIYYENICIRNAQNALLYTPYYSTRPLPTTDGVATPRYPNFHHLYLRNVRILGPSAIKLQGFQANSGGFDNPAFPLGMTMNNVVADEPEEISLIASDAKLTLEGVNLPIMNSAENRVVVRGHPTQAVDPSRVVDCTYAFVDFPTPTSPNGTTWTP